MLFLVFGYPRFLCTRKQQKKKIQNTMTKPKALSMLSVALTAIAMVADSEAGGITSKLQITLPMSLRRDGEGYDHREAMFGMPPYGGSIEQNVYYANADLCDITMDYSRGGYPTRPKDETGAMEQWKSPFILMVDRGECTFVKKVRHAQKMGAAAVILADNTCLCSSTSCVSEGTTFCETKEPVMADDGSGADVTIPSYLMFKQDADPIKEMLMEDTIVRMKMEWSLPEVDATVDYQLWTTPKEKMSRPLQREFRHVAKALGDRARFTPHMFLYDGVFSGCKSPDGENQCFSLCTNEGRYCSTDPDDDLDNGISGADVVQESLRRICIWKEYGQDGVGMPWWDYVNEFMYRCDNPNYFNSEECVKDCMQRSGVEYSKVKICMEDSGGLEGDVENKILTDELAEQSKNGVVILPSIYVNDTPLRGAPTTVEVFDAICAGYRVGGEPDICTSCSRCKDIEKCVTTGHCPGEGKLEKVSMPVFAGTLAAVIFCFGILAVVQHQRAQAQMRSQVRGIMAEYMPIDRNQSVESVGIPQEDDLDLQVEIS